MQWRLIETGYNDGFYNMAVDELLLNQVAAGKSAPVIRFYGWKPAAVSLGYFQKPEIEIDLDGCKKRGIDVVRRLTGGRAVLHNHEVTYSVIAPKVDERVSGTVIESYLKISKGLLSGLQALDIPAELVPHGSKPAADSTAACFEAPSWYELVIDGKKLVGSAQTRKKGVLLQHGSVLLDLDVEELADTIKFKDNSTKNRFKKSFLTKACAINQVMERKYDFNTVARSLAAGLEKELNIVLKKSELTDEEVSLINDLYKNYCSATSLS